MIKAIRKKTMNENEIKIFGYLHGDTFSVWQGELEQELKLEPSACLESINLLLEKGLIKKKFDTHQKKDFYRVKRLPVEYCYHSWGLEFVRDVDLGKLRLCNDCGYQSVEPKEYYEI